MFTPAMVPCSALPGNQETPPVPCFLPGWAVGWLVVRLSGCPVVLSDGCLVGWAVGLLPGLLAGCLIGRLADCLVVRLAVPGGSTAVPPPSDRPAESRQAATDNFTYPAAPRARAVPGANPCCSNYTTY